MPINNIQPLQGLNKMSLSNLSDREREQWYAANQNALSKYNPVVRKQAAELIYQNQQFIKKFGKDEFYKTANIPEAAAFRRQLLENRLVEEAWRNTFKPKHTVVTDINTGIPYMQNGKPMMFERNDDEVNVDDAWYLKYSGMDTQAKKQLLEMYGRGEWKPEKEIQKNNVFSKYEQQTPSIMSSLKYLLGDKSKENAKDVAANAAKIAQKGPITAGIELITGSLAGNIGEGRDYYNKANQQTVLDKLYDESTHRIAESPEVSRLKSAAYLDDSIVGSTDEDTKRIFYSIIMPSDPDSKDYENANLGIPTYAAYFDGGKNVQKEVQDIGIDEMREIIATKYAMEKAGIPKDRVRDMLERQALKHVANNEGWWKGKKKFVNDVAIAAAAYTADKWNGIQNLGLMYQDFQDGGVNVWVDDEGNIVGEVDHPELIRNISNSWDKKGNMSTTSTYNDNNGNSHTVHKEKILRSALLMMGKEANGDNAGGKSTSWANPEFWTKAELFGTWDEDEIKKWDKIGASPSAKAWDPDEVSHVAYESFKMMSFGLADQAMMLLPAGAGAIAKGISGASKVANGAKATLNTLSKLGPASKFGQIANNAAASLGIGFAYGRNNAYELFSKAVTENEAALRNQSEMQLQQRYNEDKEYKASVDQRIAELTQTNIQNALANNAEAIRDGRVVIDNDLLQQQAAYQAYQQVREKELQKQIDINKNSPEYQQLHEKAVNTAAYASNVMAVTDAMKYFAVGAFGYRRYLYENPTALFKKTGNTVKEALRGTKSALKHVKEVKNAEGKMRLSTAIGKDFQGLRNQAKQLGKTYASQFIGGAWTNGTDDMQVDGVQQIYEDTMQQAYDSYKEGEPIANIYGPLDQISSFMTGMGESLGQNTTWQATLVGGLGSTISGNLNFANIASLATKEGRRAFKEQYGTRYQRDNEGYIQYKDEAVVDENGNTVKDADGNPITRKVPVKENIRWWQNIPERAGFFIQNGVLNTYYGNKQAAMSKVDRVQAANNMLDEYGDFTDLEDYITADAIGDNVTSEREKRTSSFLKALRLARALDQVGKTQEGNRDIDDPTRASSVYQNAVDFIDKASSIEVYDTGVNIGNFSPEEVENTLKEWYSRHPQESRSEAKDVEVLRGIAENAKELKTAMLAYDEASNHVAESERQSNKTFSTHVKNKMVEDYVLYNHWQNRLDKLRKETNDTSSPDRQLSPEEFIASAGGITNAESLNEVYDLMIDRTKVHDKQQADKAVETSQKKLETARRKYDNAKTADEKQLAEREVNKAYSEHDNNLAMQEYVDGLISRLEEKRDQVTNALEQTKGIYVTELEDAVGNLNSRKQNESISRARNLSLTQERIQELSNKRRDNRDSFSAEDARELARLKKREQVDKKWLRNNLDMNSTQLQQFVTRVDEVHSVNTQGTVLTADEIMSLDPVTRSKMLDIENRRLYSDAQLKEIDNLRGRLNMQDPSIIEKLHDIARLGQQMDRVMDSYKRLSQHPEGAAMAIDSDKAIAAEAAYKLIDRRFAKDVANFIAEFDDKIIVNSTDESNDIVSAVIKYKDRLINNMGLRRFLEAKSKVYDEARWQGRKPQVTQRDKDNAVFQLLRTLNGRILDILNEEHLVEKYRTELDKARRWVAVVEDIASIANQTMMDENRRQEFSEHLFNLTFWCDDKEDIMRQLEIEANNPTKPEFTADILNLLDDLEELGHLRNAVVVKRNAEKYKDIFKQKANAQIKRNSDTANKAFSDDPDMQDFINNLSEDARKALESILTNSKNRKLNDDGSRYIIDNKSYARVTSIKTWLKGARLSKLDKNNSWVLPSTSIGNSLDEFGRDVFNGIYDKMTEEERLKEFEKRYTNSTAENFEEVFKALKDFQSKLLAKNQRIIKLGNSTDNQGSAVAAGTVTVTMPDGTTKEIRVAGSLDILAMDTEGNLHIYDFKTYHSKDKLNIASAVSKGYDRQLSMYAKLLEEEYGLKVASINILPVHADYPTPKNGNKFNKSGAEYKKDNADSNQLSIKDKGESKFREFKEANFKVEDTFTVVRLKGEALTIDCSKLNNEDKAELNQLLTEQGQQVAKETKQPTEATAEVSEENAKQIGEGEDIDLGEETIETKPQEQQKPEAVELDVAEINTTDTKNGKTVTGHYNVQLDDEGFVHISFDRGNAAAKRGVSLNQINLTKEQTFGKRGEWIPVSAWDRIPVNDKLSITNAEIDPDGNVTIETLYDIIDGYPARKIMEKAFPELRDYMQQYSMPRQTSEPVQLGTGEDVDLGVDAEPTKSTEENIRQIGEGEEVNLEEETPITPEETDKLHDNGTDVWVESAESNTQEAETSDDFKEYRGENQSLEDINSPEETVTDTQVATQTVDDNDTSIRPLSANANPVFHNTRNSELAKDGKLVKRTGAREGDTTNTLQQLLDAYGIKLQDIIDEELAPIFMEKPDTPIKFMAVNWISKEHSSIDKQLSTTCFLVIDYDAHVRSIHADGKNGKKNNGGVLTVQGKEYLVIGTMGWGSNEMPGSARKQALWNNIFGRNPLGFVKKAAATYFQNPENNGERFYVAKNENGEFYSTTIKEGSITPGWFVKVLEGESGNAQKRRLGELLNPEDPSKKNTVNPYGLTWSTLNFGIAEYTQFHATMDERAIMPPDNLAKNAGRVFVLVPAGNGKYAPAYIQTTHYSELTNEVSREGNQVELNPIKTDSPLAKRIDGLLDDMLARNYNDRLEALKKLYKYLYLSNGKEVGNNNFLLRKNANIISVLKDGKIIKEFNLDDTDFNRQEFKDFVRQKMNPRINITPATLRDITLLQEYDASGALLVDIAMLRTAGSNYEIWPVDANNNVLKPNEPISQHSMEEERTRGTQIPYNGQYYIKDTNGVYKDQAGNEITSPAIIEELEINRRINESGIQPESIGDNKATYILDQNVDNPFVVKVDRNLYKVTKLDKETAVDIIQKAIEKREQAARDKAAEEALNKDINQLIDGANPAKPDIAEQARSKELEEVEQSSYNAVSKVIANMSNNDIQLLIDDSQKRFNDITLNEEEKASIRGELRAYHDELNRREQQSDKESEPVKQLEIKSINQNTDDSGTITFTQLIANREHLGRLMQALSKMPDAPRQINKLTDWLKEKNINVDAIGNTQDDIDAWFTTLENCR